MWPAYNVVVMIAHHPTISGMAKKKKDRHLNPMLSVRLDPELMRLLREKAARNRRKIKEEVSIALETYVGMSPPEIPQR